MFALAGSACSYNLFYNELTRKREVSLKMWTSKDKHFRYNTGFDWNDPRAERLTGSAKYNHFWAPRAWKDDLQLCWQRSTSRKSPSWPKSTPNPRRNKRLSSHGKTSKHSRLSEKIQ